MVQATDTGLRQRMCEVLAETAACVVPLPEVFSYLLQAGRVDVGFLGAAQIDRFANLNTTVVGPYGVVSVLLWVIGEINKNLAFNEVFRRPWARC